jgi:hypothetical protein
MTGRWTDVRCPECGRPITQEKLATQGICDDCLREAVDAIPPPRESNAGREPATSEPAGGESAPTPPTNAPPAGDEEPNVLETALNLIFGAMVGAENVRANIWQIDGDDPATAIGRWCDEVVGLGREVFESLGIDPDTLGAAE